MKNLAMFCAHTFIVGIAFYLFVPRGVIEVKIVHDLPTDYRIRHSTANRIDMDVSHNVPYGVTVR